MRRLTEEDRGAALLLVALSISMLFGVGALVVDHGRSLSEYRRLTTGTDAAALAAADAYAQGETGCHAVASDFLGRNTPGARMLECQVFGDTTTGRFGWVVVSAELDVDQFFGRTLGRDVVTVRSRSVGVFGEPMASRRGGTRPMGLCINGLTEQAAYQEWLAGPATVDSAPIRVTYDKDHPDDCGASTGNWGFIDFNGGSNPNSETKDWIENGFDGEFQPGWYEGDPGAFSGSHTAALQSLVDSGTTFDLPLFVEGGGSGANTRFRITDGIHVRLVGFKSTGKQSKRYLEFVITPPPPPRDPVCCADTSGSDTGQRMTGLFLLDESGNPLGVSQP